MMVENIMSFYQYLGYCHEGGTVTFTIHIVGAHVRVDDLITDELF